MTILGGYQVLGRYQVLNHPRLTLQGAVWSGLVCCRCCVSGIWVLEESPSVPEYFRSKIVIVGGLQQEISIEM